MVTAKFERAAKPMFYMSNRDFYAAEDSEGDDERVDVEIANPCKKIIKNFSEKSFRLQIIF